eukprot:CAMPEP_0202457726 /NCGR_PEP_ID=MMETSP1360-20130828/14670_1 /ASSEMBLY_ACC=CAM_ASM_000848 /TAXON_ID=515479 /ORGANISM="Licmophora paradoxa, Strain CCMP2313" /LENGTH=508 /DNA_ID=CAMNT_0049077885 /DNA_START=38 /DNA_END=1564 /DNA_ORIENTATION=+
MVLTSITPKEERETVKSRAESSNMENNINHDNINDNINDNDNRSNNFGRTKRPLSSTLPLLFPLLLLLIIHPSSTNAQTITPGCSRTIDSFSFVELRSPNLQTYKQYTFCENRVYEVGRLDYSYNLLPGTGSPPIQLRPNLHIKCGATGKRENNCMILGGDLQLDGTSYFGGPAADLPLHNVTIEGFTFGVSSKNSGWFSKMGNITFIDCEWREHQEAVSPIYLDYFNASDTESRLEVNFIDCTFKDNVYFGEGAVPAIVSATGEQSTLHFERCTFTGNDFIFNNTNFLRNSFLIETSGDISLDRNCFLDNLIGVSPVVAYASNVNSTQNYGAVSDGRRCNFVSRFETQAQYDFFAPKCLNYEELTTCQSDITASPSMVPTQTPTGYPTISASPSAGPSQPFTALPTGTPSLPPPPTLTPTESAPTTPQPITSMPTVTSKPTEEGFVETTTTSPTSSPITTTPAPTSATQSSTRETTSSSSSSPFSEHSNRFWSCLYSVVAVTVVLMV